jgi:hypothetical protein
MPVSTISNGHCLLYAIEISMATYLGIHIPVTEIIEKMKHELLVRHTSYIPFICATQTQYIALLNKFFDDKQWNNRLVDIIPA